MGQRSLFDDIDLEDLSIDGRFRRFDEENPEVYRLFKEFALRLLAAGHKHYSADGIIHTVRYHAAVSTTRDQGFLINNDFVSRYARKLRDEDARFAAFFEFRKIGKK